MSANSVLRAVADRLLLPVTSVQQMAVRHKAIIRRCGYKEIPRLKAEDIRYQTATHHKPKLMTWQDYQVRKFKAERYKAHGGWRPFPQWQAKMDMAESMVRLGMPDWTISKVLFLHPHCVQYLRRKVSGNVELVREAEYSLWVNWKPGQY